MSASSLLPPPSARGWSLFGLALFFLSAGMAIGIAGDAAPGADGSLSFTNAPSSGLFQEHPDQAASSLAAPPAGGFVVPPPPPNPFDTTSDASGVLADHLLVVYNEKDPDSAALARYYAEKRHIPPERVLGIACSTREEISRAEYRETIHAPILSYVLEKKWMTRENRQVRVGPHVYDLLLATNNDIWAIVLIRGVPLKVAPDPGETAGIEAEPELQNNAAAVDSELALLPVEGLPDGGFFPNPFFDAGCTGITRIGPGLATKIVLVTRLDGPRPADVTRMIDDALYAEQNRLAGEAVIDSRGLTDVKNGYTSGDTWLRSARDMLLQDGWCVKFDDKSDVIPATDPLNHVALYLGWYTSNAVGPWVTPPERFQRGAIAYHLYSFSASTVHSVDQGWVGPLIANGADATMGMVYEPYLALTPHLDIFTRRLLDGDYFAEAAYASQRALSWMVTVVGDPLYRPFLKPLDAAIADSATAPSEYRDWYLLQQVQRQIAQGELAPTTPPLEQALDTPTAGASAEEGLGDLLEKRTDPGAVAGAGAAYKKALALETADIDRVRVGLKLAQHDINCNQDGLAEAELKTLRELYPADAQRFGVASQLVPTSAAPGPVALPQAPHPPHPPQPAP